MFANSDRANFAEFSFQARHEEAVKDALKRVCKYGLTYSLIYTPSPEKMGLSLSQKK
jgi:hypothetical protein